MEGKTEKYLFEEMPVPRAVATLAIPTIISQVVTMIYNLADTFFIGQMGDPYMVASVSLNPKYFTVRYLRQVFSVGIASALATILGNAANMVMVPSSSGQNTGTSTRSAIAASIIARYALQPEPTCFSTFFKMYHPRSRIFCNICTNIYYNTIYILSILPIYMGEIHPYRRRSYP